MEKTQTKEPFDNRKLDLLAKEQLRRSIIMLHKKNLRGKEIASLLGVNKNTVTSALKAYKNGGMNGLKLLPPGKKVGDSRRLTVEQERVLKGMIKDKRPEQLKMDFALWNRGAVCQLIKQQFDIDMPVRTVGDYLKRWGFTPQKPLKRAYEQQPAAVKKWLDEEYPKISKLANDEGAAIHWGDQTALQNTDVRVRGYAPKGKTAELRVPAKREKLSMMSSVSNRGKVRWMIIDGNFNAEKLIAFMELLIKDVNKKVFLVLDNLRTHHCKPVKEWLKENKEMIEVFYLPSYSPELNPDERLNANLKQAMRIKVPVRTKLKLENAAETHMKKLEQTPEMVKSFFQDAYVKYAA